jgi:hypothetical protein
VGTFPKLLTRTIVRHSERNIPLTITVRCRNSVGHDDVDIVLDVFIVVDVVAVKTPTGPVDVYLVWVAATVAVRAVGFDLYITLHDHLVGAR